MTELGDKKRRGRPRKDKELLDRHSQWQTHVYLEDDDHLALKAIAKRESRSVTRQIELFLRAAILADKSARRS